MTHPSDLKISMFVDGALAVDDVAAIKRHVDSCEHCQSQVESFSAEMFLIKQALNISENIVIPVFKRVLNIKEICLSMFGYAAVVVVLITFLKSLQISLLTDVLSWFTSFHPSDVIDVIVESVLYLSEKGAIMLNTLFNLVVTGLICGLVLYCFSSRKFLRSAMSFGFMLFFFSILLPMPAVYAMEIRSDEQMVSVGPEELIADSLVAFGETVVVDGTIDGDLIAFGRRIIINGTVTGNLVVFTQSATVSGEVEGSMLGFASDLAMDDALIGNNLWAFMQNLTMNDDSSIEGNATIFSNMAAISGNVGRDLTGFSQFIELNGHVEDDVEAFAQRVSLLGNAHIGGDIRLREAREGYTLQQAPSSVVMGTIEYLTSERRVYRNKYASPGFYMGQLVYLVAAFLAGLTLLWLFPNLKTLNLGAGSETFKTGGIGLLALVSTPIIILICAVTIIGLPFAIAGAFVWLLALFFAKILVASVLGRMIVTSPEKQKNVLLTLITGLVCVIVVSNIPMVGGWLSFVMLVLGLGMLTQKVLQYSSNLSKSSDS